MKRKIAAILAADIAGYSRLIAEDEEETLTRLSSYRAVFDDFVKRAGGRIFNTAGDSVLAEFTSAVDAVRCAIDIQESLRTRNLAFSQNRRMDFRIGITIGDVVQRGGDLLGEGVNIAARLEALAEPGGICVSQSVYDSVANKLAVRFQDIGAQEVKNIPRPVHAFRIGLHSDPVLRHSVLESAPKKPAQSASLWGAAAACAVLAAGAGWYALRPASPPQPQAAAVAPHAKPAGAEHNTAAPQPVPATAQAIPAPVPPAPALPADLAEAFRALAQQGGIVQEPKTAPEFYHNARSYEIRGDAVAARRAYMAFAGLKLNRVDPLLRLAALLRVQEGRAGAREILSDLIATYPTPAAIAVHALQFDGADRRARLEKFMADYPDFLPAHYLLAEEYSEDRLGAQQTLADRKKEMESLTRFLAADRDGLLQQFFLDHSVLSEWLDKARKRHAALDHFMRSATAAPVFQFMRHNGGWNVNVQIPEAATEIAWRMKETDEFQSTAMSPALDPRTGKPMPLPSFQLPPEMEQATLEVRYRDASGAWVGPFAQPFEWRAALVASQRQILDQFSTSWLAFRNDAPFDQLLYFTHLVSYRCAIAKAEVGFDDGPVDRELPMPPCDRKNPMAIPSSMTPYIKINPGVKSVTVKLTYADGAQSKPVTIRR